MTSETRRARPWTINAGGTADDSAASGPVNGNRQLRNTLHQALASAQRNNEHCTGSARQKSATSRGEVFQAETWMKF